MRTLADCRAIIEAAKGARRAVVVGASFIGLEVAASLRARNIEVHVVAPEKRPMERVLGAEMGDFIRALHEEHGVVFHLENTVAAIEGRRVILKSGETIEAELVVVGHRRAARRRPGRTGGPRASTAACWSMNILKRASRTSTPPAISRAGRTRTAARTSAWSIGSSPSVRARPRRATCSGDREKFDAAPFFWSQHYDVPINYVGHAEQWDEIAVEGDIRGKDCLLQYKRGGRVLAVASIFRDVANLQAEAAMEREARAP